eukprot:2084717-Pyramimonas_sp.AAC.1
MLVDLGNKGVQDAVMHYSDVCFVNVVLLKPNGRTIGMPSYFNSKVNYDTWHGHQKEDLPHIKFCGRGAVRQNDLRRFYLREQLVGTWVDEIAPWTRLAKCEGICKVNMGQCTTDFRDPHGVFIRKPIEIMANRRLLLTPFERKRCTGYHQHASA